VGREVIFGVRPEGIHDRALAGGLGSGDGSGATVMVDVTEPMGSSVYAYLTAGKHSLIADLDAETRARDGQPLEVVFEMDKTHLFDPETEAALT